MLSGFELYPRWVPLNKCRLCGETTSRKNYFFSDSGKALQLKKIILRVCEIEVSERDELPKFCCRSCHDKVLRLNKNLEIFASTCQSTQKELERELKTSRQENIKKRSRTGNTPQSTEKPRKIPHSMVNVGNQRTSDQEVSIHKQYKMFCFCYTFTTRKSGKSTSA